ncbi:MAG: glycosyltransferase family 4 protein [Acidobacteria bacterium]|nr:glycosyltransferase family 4 protein [Acidobacteriota bacterium]
MGDNSSPSFVRVMRALNSQWGRGRRALAFKDFLRARAPRLFIGMKAGFGRVEDEATWTNLLTEQERADLALLRRYDPPPQEIDATRRLNETFLAARAAPRSINWFVPSISHPLYGGLNTILRFASRLQDAHGVETRVVLYDYDPRDAPKIRRETEDAFPTVAPRLVFHAGRGADDLPPADVCVATYWTSAFLVSRVQNTRAKFYFIQDYEPSFYEGGTRHGLVDTTYRLGLLRLVNTPGLRDWIDSLHGGGGTAFLPSVDTDVYRPDETRPAAPPRVKIFFYARPLNARNGFILGMEALKRVKARLGDRVEIVAAGEEWNPLSYGAAGAVENLGRLTTRQAVADLYRSCDIGLVFMFSRHPSYQPFEFMASGCAVVTNDNRATRWMLKHEENAIVCEATVESVAQSIGRLVEDAPLRRRLRAAGLRTVAQESWDDTIDDACRRAGLLAP